jgi:aerobic carbon-monoxide dehydrogenase medium subunit
MYSAPFEYHRARSIEEAVALLGQHGDDAKLLAGGHSLIPLLKLRFAQPRHLIDVRKIPHLAGIREEDGAIVIGAATTHAQMERSSVAVRRLPILAEAASQIGDPLVRNVGTVGGSLAHADPGADWPAVMLAVNAEFRVVGPRGTRTIMADDFFLDILTTALEPTEMLTEIRIPSPSATTGGAYAKFRHPASGYALIGVAAQVSLGARNTIRDARLAVTGVSTRATRARGTEQALTGTAGDEASIAAAARRIIEGFEPRADSQGSVAYKQHLAAAYARRAIAKAIERAGEG